MYKIMKHKSISNQWRHSLLQLIIQCRVYRKSECVFPGLVSVVPNPARPEVTLKGNRFKELGFRSQMLQWGTDVSLHTLQPKALFVLSMSYVKRIVVYALKKDFCVVRYDLNFKVNLETWFKISAQPLPHLCQPRVAIHGISPLHFSRSRVSLQQNVHLNYHGRFDAYTRNQQWIVFRVPGVTVNLK